VRDGVLFALSIVGLGLYLWWSIGLTNFGHTDPFLPAGEPLWQFLLVGTARDLHLLLALPESRVLAALVLVALGAGIVQLVRKRPRSRDQLLRAAPSLVLVVLVLILMLAAIAKRYPFGGPMRHQFVLFPFLVLVIAQAIARVRKAGPVLVFALALGWGAFALREPLPDDNLWNPLWTSDSATVRAEVGSGCLYLPVYSLYGFYGGLGRARWTAVESCGPRCRQFLVEDQGPPFHVLRDSATWEPYDPSVEAFAARLIEVSRASPRCGGAMWLHALDRPPASSFRDPVRPLVDKRVSLAAGELWLVKPDPVARGGNPAHN
jgi:hypothetical protein